jgi:hypothetical protein
MKAFIALTPKTMISVMTLSAIIIASNTQASNPTANFELGAGLEHDSNLNIIELDKNAHESDTATVLNAKADTQWKASDKFTLSGGYAYSTKIYQNNPEYDLAINQLSADANYDFDVLTLGASYNYANAKLDKKSFLDLRQTSFYASKLFDNRIYLRAATNLQDKSFNNLSARNATNTGLAGDVFVFFNEGKTFVAFGVTNEEEDAKAKEFDYKGMTLKTKLSNKFSLWEKDSKLQLGWRYFTHDYSGITPEINKERYDSGHVGDIEWELAFTPHISMLTKIEFSKYNSNLAAANYSDTTTSLTLKARF